MEFIFDEHKATQAAAYLLRRGGGRMRYMKLIKLLYLADRTALIETGSPITGDRFVAMKLVPCAQPCPRLDQEPGSGRRVDLAVQHCL